MLLLFGELRMLQLVPSVGEAQPDVRAGDAPFELLRRALGDDSASVEHGDPVGELVGLLQVLRGEHDGDALGDEVANEPPLSCDGPATTVLSALARPSFKRRRRQSGASLDNPRSRE